MLPSRLTKQQAENDTFNRFCPKNRTETGKSGQKSGKNRGFTSGTGKNDTYDRHLEARQHRSRRRSRMPGAHGRNRLRATPGEVPHVENPVENCCICNKNLVESTV